MPAELVAEETITVGVEEIPLEARVGIGDFSMSDSGSSCLLTSPA